MANTERKEDSRRYVRRDSEGRLVGWGNPVANPGQKGQVVPDFTGKTLRAVRRILAVVRECPIGRWLEVRPAYWSHRQPTFNGFREFLRRRAKR